MLLFLLKKYSVSKVLTGYLLGILMLFTASYIIGAALTAFLPEWILGGLGVLPLYMAFHADGDEEKNISSKSQILSVLITYLSVCAGCNLAIFLPVLIGKTLASFLSTLLFIGVLSVLAVFLIKAAAGISIVSKLMARYGEILMKICYVLIGLYVFYDSGLISHLLALFYVKILIYILVLT
ncbi:integral membrane protein [Liquorilactobacillus oeni DSM 19972]|uniref:Integral membrane protein n=1 Tax=Liquorilactobacillus oeni DSM 19972 TaxID=1423777 RepID=A0A0R1M8X9_9LACO|nr:integral membrane protein [Liquorilactobacillus oeni DSM 19972]